MHAGRYSVYESYCVKKTGLYRPFLLSCSSDHMHMVLRKQLVLGNIPPYGLFLVNKDFLYTSRRGNVNADTKSLFLSLVGVKLF